MFTYLKELDKTSMVNKFTFDKIHSLRFKERNALSAQEKSLKNGLHNISKWELYFIYTVRYQKYVQSKVISTNLL